MLLSQNFTNHNDMTLFSLIFYTFKRYDDIKLFIIFWWMKIY